MRLRLIQPIMTTAWWQGFDRATPSAVPISHSDRTNRARVIYQGIRYCCDLTSTWTVSSTSAAVKSVTTTEVIIGYESILFRAFLYLGVFYGSIHGLSWLHYFAGDAPAALTSVTVWSLRMTLGQTLRSMVESSATVNRYSRLETFGLCTRQHGLAK